MSRRTTITKGLKWGLVALAVPVCLMAGALVLLQTSWGREQLVRAVEWTVGAGGDTRLKIGGLEGFPPFHFAIRKMALADRDGPWLEVDNLSFRLGGVGALLSGGLAVRSCRADELRVFRMPVGETAPAPKEGGGNPLPAAAAILRRLSVGDLSAQRIVVERPVLGRAAVFSLGASLGMAGGGEGRVGRVAFERRDQGPPTRFTAGFQLGSGGNHLAFDAELQEAPDGLLAGFLSIPGGIEVTLKGAGGQDALKGRLKGHAGPWGPADLALGLELGDAAVLTLDGTLAFNRELLPPAWTAWYGRAPAIDLRVRVDDPDRLLLERLRVDSGTALLEARGAFDLKGRQADGSFTFRVPDLSPLEGVWGSAAGGRLEVAGTFKGPFDRPDAQLHLALEDFQAGAMHLGRFGGDLDISPIARLEEPFAGLRLKGQGNIAGLVVGDRKPLGAAVFGWRAAFEGPSDAGWRVESLELFAPGQALALAGTLDPGAMRGQAEVSLSSADLQALTEPWGCPVPGAAELKVLLRSTGMENVRADFSGTLGMPGRNLPRGIPPALEGRWVIDGKARLGAGGLVTLESFTLGGPAATLKASGSLDGKNLRADAAWELHAAEVAGLAGDFGLPLSGALDVSGFLTGALRAPDMRLKILGTRFEAGGIPLPGLEMQLSLSGPFREARGDLRVSVVEKEGPYRLSAAWALKRGALSADPIAVAAPGLEAGGRLNLNAEAVEGRLDGRAKSFAFLGPFMDADVAGAAAFHIHVSPDAGGQSVRFDLTGTGLGGKFGEAAAVKAAGTVSRAFSRPELEARLDAQGLRGVGLNVASLLLDVQADAMAGSFKGQAQGAYGSPFSLAFGGALTWGTPAKTVTLSDLKGSYGGYPLRLTQPVTLKWKGADTDLGDLSMAFGKGKLLAAAHIKASVLDADVRITDWPIEAVPQIKSRDLKGLLDGTIRLSGPLASPEGKAELQLRHVVLVDPGLAGLPDISLSGEAGTVPGGVFAKVAVQAGGREIVAAEGRLPLELSLSPVGWRLAGEQGLVGRIRTGLDLALVKALAEWEGQELGGTLVSDIRLAGSWEAPVLDGKVEIENGLYENVRTGTVLKEVAVRIAGGLQKLQIVEGRANDGAGGTVAAAGWMRLEPDQGFPAHLDVTLKDATLIRREDATVTANGSLHFSGGVSDMLLGGEVAVGPAEVRIPENLPPEVAVLDVTEINGPVRAGSPAGDGAFSPSPVKIRLQLTVSSPGRVFMRGRGLNSEWAGSLKITGPAAAPVVVGRLSLVRGLFTFLGKPFQLTRGEIRFDGSVPPVPYVDVLAEAASGGITANIALTWTPSGLRLALTSVPPLPSDEILSRVLFKRSASTLNAVQALQLAGAVRTLTGGGGLDFMSRTRKLLDMDQLQIKSPEDGSNASTLAAGKYLSQRVYLEVERGLGLESGRISVEVEITPNITWEADVGENSEGGIGIKWRRDY